MPRPHMELIEWCTLVDEECEWDDCEGCPNNIRTLTQHEENLQECEFVREIVINNILPVMVNKSNTIARTQWIKDVKRFVEYHNLKKTGYSPANLKQYPLFFMLKKTLGLGVPRKIYIAKDKTCVAIYESDVYLIGPRIESE